MYEITEISKSITDFVCLLQVPDQSSTTLELLVTQLTVELGWVALHTPDVMVLHPVHSGALKLTFLRQLKNND